MNANTLNRIHGYTFQGTEKRCPKCNESKPLNEFGFNRANKDGIAAYCKPCYREAHRHYRKDKPFVWVSDPDKHNAHMAVKAAIKSKAIPKAKECECVDCGETARDYHHVAPVCYTNPDLYLRVVPLCRSCHMLRHARPGTYTNIKR